MKNLLKTYRKIDLKLFKFSPYILAISVFLLHIPYYDIPYINTYFYARILTLLLFAYICFSYLLQKERKLLHNNKTFKLLIFFVFTTSLSIFATQNISAFISNYEDIVLSTLFYINCYVLLRKNAYIVIKLLIISLISSTIISVIDELLLLINPHIYLQLAKHVLHQNQYEFILSSNFRGRLFVNRFNEMFIPLLIIFITYGNRFKKVIFSLLLFSISILALFSGWRIRLATVIVALLSTPLFIITNIKKKIIISGLLIVLLLSFLVVSDLIMTKMIGYSTIGRLILEDKSDVTALTVRLDFFGKAIELFKASPIIGVGLGQYSLLGDRPYENYYSFFRESEIEADLLSTGPHNIFFHLLAETGLLGFMAFTILIIHFILSDWHRWKSKKMNLFNISLLLGFWILFSFALFHSEFGFQFYSLLWAVRAMNDIDEKFGILPI